MQRSDALDRIPPTHLLAREGGEQGELARGSPPLQQGSIQVILVAAAAAKEQHALPKAGAAASLLQGTGHGRQAAGWAWV